MGGARKVAETVCLRERAGFLQRNIHGFPACDGGQKSVWHPPLQASPALRSSRWQQPPARQGAAAAAKLWEEQRLLLAMIGQF